MGNAPLPAAARGRVAVVTGAASGIGLAVARRCAALGMKVVLSDIDEAGLKRAAAELAASGATAAAIAGDVTKEESMAELCDKVYALQGFGEVGFLFLNAGFSTGTSVLKTPIAAWRRQLDVNLFGVLHGLRAFVPKMLAQRTPARVVATSSYAGLLNVSTLGVGAGAAYTVSKHAVTLSMEGLAHELRSQKGCEVTAHILCPGAVNTNYMSVTMREAERNSGKPAVARSAAEVGGMMAGALQPEQVADALLRGLEAGDFYILAPDSTQPPEMLHAMLKIRTEDITGGRAPLSHLLGDGLGKQGRATIKAARKAGVERQGRGAKL